MPFYAGDIAAGPPASSTADVKDVQSSIIRLQDDVGPVQSLSINQVVRHLKRTPVKSKLASELNAKVLMLLE